MRNLLLSALLIFPATGFAQHFAADVEKDGIWRTIDERGRTIRIDSDRNDVRFVADFRESRSSGSDTVLSEDIYCIAAGIPPDQRYRYFHLNGLPVIDSNFSFGEPFRDGHAMVMAGDAINAIDRQGHFLLQRRIPGMHPLNDAASILADRILVMVPEKDKICNCPTGGPRFGYMKRDGTWAIEPTFREADIFSNGFAKTSASGEHYGYIGLSGEWLIDPVYEAGTRFMPTRFE